LDLIFSTSEFFRYPAKLNIFISIELAHKLFYIFMYYKVGFRLNFNKISS